MFKGLRWEDRLYLLSTIPDGQVARGLLETFEFTDAGRAREEINMRLIRGLPIRVPRLNLSPASIQRAIDVQPSRSKATAVNFLLQVGNSYTAARRSQRLLKYLTKQRFQSWDRTQERVAYGMMPEDLEGNDWVFTAYGGVARISSDRMRMVNFDDSLRSNWLTMGSVYGRDKYQHLTKRHASSREHVTFKLGRTMWRLFGDDLGAWDLAWELMRFEEVPIRQALETTSSAIEGKRTLPVQGPRNTPWLFRVPATVSFNGSEVFGPQNNWNIASVKRQTPGR